jgi:ABC-type amino acid transport system permease subunit
VDDEGREQQASTLCYGAYRAEIFCAGIQGVPPTGNQFIAMLKDSSLVSVMGVWELMFLAKTQGRIETYYGKGHQR